MVAITFVNIQKSLLYNRVEQALQYNILSKCLFTPFFFAVLKFYYHTVTRFTSSYGRITHITIEFHLFHNSVIQNDLSSY